jgi:hypothetical protein
MQALEAMKEAGVARDTVTYSVLISVCGRCVTQ